MSLIACRRVASHRRTFRILWLFVILCIPLSGVARWEIHSHAGADAHHSHAADHHTAGHPHAEPDHERTDNSTEPAQQAALPHMHDVHSPTIAIVVVEFRATLPTASTCVARFDDTAQDLDPQQPPHRPPIA